METNYWAGLSLIADYFTGSRRSLAIGIHMTGLYVGQAVGGFGATVAAAFSWQTTFHWFGIVGIVYALVLILLLAVLGGGAFAYIKFIRPKQASKASADPDDYDFADEEEYINEDEPEQEEETEDTK